LTFLRTCIYLVRVALDIGTVWFSGMRSSVLCLCCLV